MFWSWVLRSCCRWWATWRGWAWTSPAEACLPSTRPLITPAPKVINSSFPDHGWGGAKMDKPMEIAAWVFLACKILGAFGGSARVDKSVRVNKLHNDPLRPEQQWCVIGFEQPHILCCTLLYFAVLSCTVLYFYFVVTPQSNMPPPPTDSEPPTNSEPPILRGSGILLPK